MSASAVLTAASHQPELPPGAGEILEAARAAAGISVEAVAATLDITPREVAALESGRYDELSQAVFVRSYLRAYAHLLDLPSSLVLKAFDRQSHERLNRGSPNAPNVPHAPRDRLPLRTVGWSVAATLLVLTSGWWWHTQLGAQAVVETPRATSVEGSRLTRGDPGHIPSKRPFEPAQPAGRANEPMVQDNTAGTDDPPRVPARIPLGHRPPPVARVLPAPPQPQQGSPEKSAATAAAGAQGLNRVEPAMAATAEVGAPKTTADGQLPPGDAAVTEDRLVIRLRYDSWIEISDKTGNQLYRGLAKGGSQISRTGKAPLKVLIGYAHDVEVEYDGQSYDATPRRGKDVARLTIGRSARLGSDRNQVKAGLPGTEKVGRIAL